MNETCVTERQIQSPNLESPNFSPKTSPVEERKLQTGDQCLYWYAT